MANFCQIWFLTGKQYEGCRWILDFDIFLIKNQVSQLIKEKQQTSSQHRTECRFDIADGWQDQQTSEEKPFFFYCNPQTQDIVLLKFGFLVRQYTFKTTKERKKGTHSIWIGDTLMPRRSSFLVFDRQRCFPAPEKCFLVPLQQGPSRLPSGAPFQPRSRGEEVAQGKLLSTAKYHFAIMIMIIIHTVVTMHYNIFK